MGRTIIKAGQSQDLYVEWSSIVEAPTFIGTRTEIEAYLKGQARRDPFAFNEIAVRLERADEHGSSAIEPGDNWWDDSGLIFEQRGWLPRARYAEFFRSFDRDGNANMSLLEPFEDEGPRRGGRRVEWIVGTFITTRPI